MQILELINTLELGGAERLTTSLASRLSERGHSVHIVCLRNSHTPLIAAQQLREMGVKLAFLNKTDGLSLTVLRQLAGYIEANQIEVIHTHNPLVHHYGAFAARLAGVPAVVNTIHGISTLRMPAWAKTLFRASCLATDRVVCVCQAVEDAVSAQFPKLCRTSVIYNGIPLDDFFRKQRRSRDGAFVFGAVGRLVPVKDHGSLIRAFGEVWRRYPQCRLEILGGGELQADLDRLAGELGVQEQVKFHGFREEVPEFLSGLDVFVLPSLSEGFPLTVLEAMASGLPVIASAVGGVVELVRNADCGWLSEPAQPEALAQIMIRALHDDHLADRGERGRISVGQHYSLPAMVSQYESLFDHLLAA